MTRSVARSPSASGAVDLDVIMFEVVLPVQSLSVGGEWSSEFDFADGVFYHSPSTASVIVDNGTAPVNARN